MYTVPEAPVPDRSRYSPDVLGPSAPDARRTAE
jgi:hypothetical protein